MRYVDGFVLPLPTKNVDAYRRMAQVASEVWLDHGALEYRECVGEDLSPTFGVPFTRGVKAKNGETVVFAWIVFRSRAHRDRVNAKVMKDPRLSQFADAPMPFDVKRMIYGGFDVLVEAGATPGGKKTAAKKTAAKKTAAKKTAGKKTARKKTAGKR